MTKYRIYCFDELHRLVSWLVVTGASDTEATAVATDLLNGCVTVEVVEASRLVVKLTRRRGPDEQRRRDFGPAGGRPVAGGVYGYAAGKQE